MADFVSWETLRTLTVFFDIGLFLKFLFIAERIAVAMSVRNQPTGKLIRELYARFGLAYYRSEVLHRGLCIIWANTGLPRRDLVTRSRIEEKLVEAFALTFGEVITKLRGSIPEEYLIQLDQALTARNFLAHHFWFDRAHLMFRSDQVKGLIEELDGYARVFNDLERDTSQWFDVKRRELGITDEALQDCMTQILSGHPEEPLPDQKTIKAVDKKLKQRQRLVRVWELILPAGGKPLIFETDGEELWQLCDVGLGLTQYDHPEPGWIEQSEIQHYLPAYIVPRPKISRPWEYEFQLQKGAILWIKPGKAESTFIWGIKLI